ncbi:MAG: 6-carboxytetrahydropterin synthase [Vampirovibrionales bacterium]|nr:6-carboxytetrahydropterin synthase [Vampirovibrionales bacterium]
MFEVMIEGHFCAARHLLNYQGPCAQIHGHNFKVQAYAQTRTLDAANVAIDFNVMQAALNKLLQHLDHQDLNALEAFKGVSPSTEFLCQWLFEALLPSVPQLSKITIWDMPGSCVSYWP